jgi:Family of unknown function (DUF6069)
MDTSYPMNDTITQLRAILMQFSDRVTHLGGSMAQVSAFRTPNREGRDGGQISAARLTWATVFAALIAVGATMALYSLASAAGLIDPRVVLPSVFGMGPLSLASVSATAALATAAAGVVLGVLARSTGRPLRNFRVLATALAVLSLSMPATIHGPSAAMRLTMAGMHVIVWAVCVGVLARLARRPIGDAA